jgi:hypothetical protein
MKLVSISGITGAVYLVSTIFATRESTRCICCFKGQKGEFVRIIIMFSFLRVKYFLHVTVFIPL